MYFYCRNRFQSWGSGSEARWDAARWPRRRTKMREYVIYANWDDEAQVWVAESQDVPGLVTEAPTEEALLEKLRVMIPELLELNASQAAMPEYVMRWHW